MIRVLTWLFVFLLVLIHTADMLLTQYQIGNRWQLESFPLMAWSIRRLGIDASLWLSRLLVYSYVLVCVWQEGSRRSLYVLIVLTVLYVTAMVPWLFALELIRWPFLPF